MSIHRPYSSSSRPPPPNPPPHSATQYSRSNFKILPFLSIIAIGTASYVLLAKSRAAERQSARSSQR
ncbi:uncharacterized protein BDV14DRAFT_176373 [Aspergillus stella-maris]|uniref:uncharacterized protein n=1 Tax=Aspergillus stella-maris TaxID=1810926 RepID=UPI003CCD71D6